MDVTSMEDEGLQIHLIRQPLKSDFFNLDGGLVPYFIFFADRVNETLIHLSLVLSPRNLDFLQLPTLVTRLTFDM